MDRVPTRQVIAATALVGLAIAGSWWTHTGPWAWLLDLQLELLGVWSATLNVMLLLGVGLALALVPLAIFHEQRQTPPGPRPDLGWIHTTAGKALLVGAMLTSIALYQALEAVRAGDLVDVAPEALAGSSARYVRVPTERAELGLAVGLDDDWYVPVVEDGSVIAVFAVDPFDEPTPEDLEPGEGMWAPFGLPGPVNSAWRQQGLSVDPRVPVVDLEASPGRATFMAGFLAMFGVPAMIGGAVLVRRQRDPTNSA